MEVNMSGQFLWIVGGILFFLLGIRIVRPVDRGLIEFLGKYVRTAEPGFHWSQDRQQRKAAWKLAKSHKHHYRT